MDFATQAGSRSAITPACDSESDSDSDRRTRTRTDPDSESGSADSGSNFKFKLPVNLKPPRTQPEAASGSLARTVTPAARGASDSGACAVTLAHT